MRTEDNSKIRTVVSAIVLLAGVGVLAFLLQRQSLEATLGSGLFLETYRFLLVVVLGGGVTLLYNRFKTSQDRQADERAREQDLARVRREELRRVWDELSSLYGSTLRQISTSRAKLLREYRETKKTSMPVEVYLSLVYDLSEIQIRMSDLHQRMLSQDFTWDDLANKTNALPMAEYLDAIVAEQERAMSNIQPSVDFINRVEVPNLMEFLGEETVAPQSWHELFQRRYYEVVRKISKAVLAV